MARLENNRTKTKNAFREYKFSNVVMTLGKVPYKVKSFQIDDLDCKWMGPHTNVIRLELYTNIKDAYHNYIGNHGYNLDVGISIEMLEGEKAIELSNGYITSYKGTEVILVIDLIPEELKTHLNYTIDKTNFRDLILSEKERQEKVTKAEKKQPNLQRFRIAIEED